jgi:3D (Asp-Asp-Asp) domain-containing protein
MKKLTVVILIGMLLLITYTVTFCKPEGKYFILKVTGYCPCEICCGEWANGLTYTGDKAGRGCVAIDPKNGPLEMGQKVYIEGYGFGVCNDIGGAIKGWEADVCFDTHQEALDWGVRLVKVYVIKEVK